MIKRSLSKVVNAQDFLILEKEKSIMDKTTLIYFTITQFCGKIKNMIKDKAYHQKYRVVHV